MDKFPIKFLLELWRVALRFHNEEQWLFVNGYISGAIHMAEAIENKDYIDIEFINDLDFLKSIARQHVILAKERVIAISMDNIFLVKDQYK